MEPAILRFEVDAPDSAELRHYLRHASSLLAGSEVEGAQRAIVLRRARAWLLAALMGIDQNLRTSEPHEVAFEIANRPTEERAAPDEVLPVLPRTLVRCRRPE